MDKVNRLKKEFGFEGSIPDLLKHVNAEMDLVDNTGTTKEQVEVLMRVLYQ